MMKTGSQRPREREHRRHLERVFWIDHEIRAGRYPNNTTIARHFEIATKTAQRTIDFMRDRLRLPVAYSNEHRGWYYTEPVYALPAIELTEGDLIAIFLAERLARQYRGKTLDRVTIQRLIEQSLKDVGESDEKAINLDIHNWTFEKYDRAADYVIDWSSLFSRETRKVPPMKMWNEKLLPELYDLRKQMAKETETRLIKLRGKNTLTTGLALGAAFPQNGGWIFEIPQPPLPTPWRSDAIPEAAYLLKTDETLATSDGDSIAYVFNIKGNNA